ncbi:MAG: hypothetical protein LBI20_04250 [Holosporales bacterium]|jgi:hypothetical protein|nr:hypothetical protein [Holosporales bacterium]
MKKNITAMLHEKITLMGQNNDTLLHMPTTVQRFSDIVNTRAFIRPIHGLEDGIYEVITLIPSIVKSRTITGIRWNNIEYECISVFKEYESKYFKGNVKRIHRT